MATPIAILTSDWHLSHKPPPARAETDWYKVQARYIGQVRDLCAKYQCPLVIAGDLFDRWDSPPELINFAISQLGSFRYGRYAVPGQHDLPNHDLGQIKRSAYYTLVKSGVVFNLDPNLENDRDREGEGIGELEEDWRIIGFPWGVPVEPAPNKDYKYKYLAVVHKYIWFMGAKHPGADEESSITSMRKVLGSYGAVVVGDNHSPWKTALASTTDPKQRCVTVLNCGTFIRRKSDEIDYKPRVGILYDNGDIQEHFLDTYKDRFRSVQEITPEVVGLDSKELLEELRKLGDSGLNFKEAVNRLMRMEKVRKEVFDWIVQHVREEK